MLNEVVLKIFAMGYVKIHGFHGNPLWIREWGYAYKITHISAVTYPRLLNLKPNCSMADAFSFDLC